VRVLHSRHVDAKLAGIRHQVANHVNSAQTPLLRFVADPLLLWTCVVQLAVAQQISASAVCVERTMSTRPRPIASSRTVAPSTAAQTVAPRFSRNLKDSIMHGSLQGPASISAKRLESRGKLRCLVSLPIWLFVQRTVSSIYVALKSRLKAHYFRRT